MPECAPNTPWHCLWHAIPRTSLMLICALLVHCCLLAGNQLPRLPSHQLPLPATTGARAAAMSTLLPLYDSPTGSTITNWASACRLTFVPPFHLVLYYIQHRLASAPLLSGQVRFRWTRNHHCANLMHAPDLTCCQSGTRSGTSSLTLGLRHPNKNSEGLLALAQRVTPSLSLRRMHHQCHCQTSPICM